MLRKSTAESPAHGPRRAPGVEFGAARNDLARDRVGHDEPLGVGDEVGAGVGEASVEEDEAVEPRDHPRHERLHPPDRAQLREDAPVDDAEDALSRRKRWKHEEGVAQVPGDLGRYARPEHRRVRVPPQLPPPCERRAGVATCPCERRRRLGAQFEAVRPLQRHAGDLADGAEQRCHALGRDGLPGGGRREVASDDEAGRGGGCRVSHGRRGRWWPSARARAGRGR